MTEKISLETFAHASLQDVLSSVALFFHPHHYDVWTQYLLLLLLLLLLLRKVVEK